jgi:hypothetical protein
MVRSMRSTNYEAPHYVVVFALLLLPLSYLQIFSSEHCCQIYIFNTNYKAVM